MGLMLMAWWCAPADAQQVLLQRNYDNDGKTRIEVNAILGTGLSRGYLPVRVTVRNSTAINRTWNLSFSYSGGWREMGYRSEFSVSAAPGAEEIHELLVPVPTTMNSGIELPADRGERLGRPACRAEQNINSEQSQSRTGPRWR
jgi:hypothetical protein